MRKRLGKHRPSDDDVNRGGVAADGAFFPSMGQNLFEQVADLGSKRNGPLVDGDGSTVRLERGRGWQQHRCAAVECGDVTL
jgi:hypothetical protein